MTALDSATYVVPDHGFGVIHNLPIADVSPEVFSDLLEATASEAGYLSAELGPRTANQGFAISVGDSLIGHLSTADSQAYALFDWILGAGLHPRVTAHLSMMDASGEEWPTLELLMPAPHLCIPANNPPAQRWTMLQGEAAATLTNFAKDVIAFPEAEEHYLVSLRTRGFLRRHTVDVYINSTFLGSLPREAARKIAPSVLDCTKAGRLAIAHGYFRYNADNQPALTIYAHNAANKHHTGLILGAIAGGSAVMSAATAARARAASAVPTAPASGTSAAGASASGVAAAGGFEVAAAAGASGAITSSFLAAAGAAVLVGSGATVATNLLSDDEALSDTTAHSTAPAPEDNPSTIDSSHFEGTGPKHPAHPATPRIHDAGPTSGTSTSSAKHPLTDSPSKATQRQTSTPQASQPSKSSRTAHPTHTGRAKAPAANHHENRRDTHSGEHPGKHQDKDSQTISRAAAAAMAPANNVDPSPTSAPASELSRTKATSTPSSSSEPTPQVAAEAPTATSSSSQSAKPSQATTSTESTASTEAPTNTTTPTEISSPAEPSDLPTSNTPASTKTTSEKAKAETTAAASTDKQTAEPSSSATSSPTNEPTLEPTQAVESSTPAPASASAQPEPESSGPNSSEPITPTRTSTLLTSEPEPTPEPEPEVTVEPKPALPTTDRRAPYGPDVPLVPLDPAEPEEPGRPEEPEEPTTPPKVIVIVVED